jgi:hypothetical protein
VSALLAARNPGLMGELAALRERAARVGGNYRSMGEEEIRARATGGGAYARPYEPETVEEERPEDRVVRAVALGIVADLARGHPSLHELTALAALPPDASSADGLMTTRMLVSAAKAAVAAVKLKRAGRRSVRGSLASPASPSRRRSFVAGSAAPRLSIASPSPGLPRSVGAGRPSIRAPPPAASPPLGSPAAPPTAAALMSPVARLASKFGAAAAAQRAAGGTSSAGRPLAAVDAPGGSARSAFSVHAFAPAADGSRAKGAGDSDSDGVPAFWGVRRPLSPQEMLALSLKVKVGGVLKADVDTFGHLCKLLDPARSGRIPMEPLRALLNAESALPYTRRQLEALYLSADKGSRGFIGVDAFAAVMFPKCDTGQLRELVGYVTYAGPAPDEIRASHIRSNEGAMELLRCLFDAYDTDGSGAIDRGELEAAFAAVRRADVQSKRGGTHGMDRSYGAQAGGPGAAAAATSPQPSQQQAGAGPTVPRPTQASVGVSAAAGVATPGYTRDVVEDAELHAQELGFAGAEAGGGISFDDFVKLLGPHLVGL